MILPVLLRTSDRDKTKEEYMHTHAHTRTADCWKEKEQGQYSGLVGRKTEESLWLAQTVGTLSQLTCSFPASTRAPLPAWKGLTQAGLKVAAGAGK